MHWPQIVMIVLLALGVSRGVLKHGEPDGHVNVFATVISTAVTIWLLWAGGFWGGQS